MDNWSAVEQALTNVSRGCSVVQAEVDRIKPRDEIESQEADAIRKIAHAQRIIAQELAGLAGRRAANSCPGVRNTRGLKMLDPLQESVPR